MTTKSAEPAKPGIVWGPTIAAACGGCRTCVAGCSHCATLCEAGAISFPTTEDLRRARRGG